MIHIDAVWLATEPIDMRGGVDTALARVVKVFGASHPHQTYLFTNRRASRMKVLEHDGIGLLLAAQRLLHDHFVWPHSNDKAQVSLSRYSPVLKIQITKQCRQSGASVADTEQLFSSGRLHRNLSPNTGH